MKRYQQTLALLVSMGLGASSMTVMARDVQLRDRPGLDEETTTSSPMVQQPRVDTESMSMEDRVRRLERILDSKGLVSLMVQQQELQQELQQLRGEIEVQSHTLEELKKRQRELYVDIDRRLLAVERNGGRQASSHAPAVIDSKPAIPTGTKQPVATKPSPAQAQDEQEAYQKAFDLLRGLRYDKAIEAFREFLQQFPNGRYAHIAQYWIGEANYAQRRFDAAIADYQALLNNYPNSPKLAEAMLKIGYSQFELKRYDQARESLERLIKTYPGTTEAGQGQNLLQKIKLLQSENGAAQ
jgi:tol-pal system protein YbgF